MTRPDVAVCAGAGRTVADAMVTDVKISAVDTTVAQVQALFADEHVQAAVIVEQGRLLTVVDRADLTDDSPTGWPAVRLGRRDGRVVAPTADLGQARELLLASGRRRLAVVDADGTLRGLLCLKRSRTGFCSNADVRARARR